MTEEIRRVKNLKENYLKSPVSRYLPRGPEMAFFTGLFKVYFLKYVKNHQITEKDKFTRNT